MNPQDAGREQRGPSWPRGFGTWGAFLSVAVLVAGSGATSAAGAVTWREAQRQPAAWYAASDAQMIADTVLLHQHASGGWPKNRDMTQPPAAALAQDRETDEPTIDNGGTWTQLRFLARVHAAAPEGSPARKHYAAAMQRGLDYLLDAQYENGGWPQFFPLRPGYYTHITFNDDAMVRVLELLRDVAAKTPEFTWIDAQRRARAEDAVQRGIDCILRCQIVVNGVRTVWCAQHDETTFAPAPARKFEPASFSGFESVAIVRLLMSVEPPTPEIIAAIEAAVAWFDLVKITGIRIATPPAPELPHGHDRVVVSDPAAPPLWARFYELGTNRPIFTGRDAIVRYALAEIEAERRGGYLWYTEAPARLLERDYPQWRRKHGLP